MSGNAGKHPLGTPTRAELDEKIAGALAGTRTDIGKYIVGTNETITQLAEEVDELRGASEGFANMALRRITRLEERIDDFEARTVRGRWQRFRTWCDEQLAYVRDGWRAIVEAIDP